MAIVRPEVYQKLKEDEEAINEIEEIEQKFPSQDDIQSVIEFKKTVEKLYSQKESKNGE